MMKNRVIILLFALAVTAGANAQKDTSLVRTVVVENKYNPKILDASKINILPKVDEPKANKKAIEYIYSSKPATSWAYAPMSPIENVIKEDKARNGEVTAGYGNYGNVILDGKYDWRPTQNDRFNIEAGINGMNGTLNGWDGNDWKARFYSSHIGVDFIHIFKSIVLNVGGKYNSQVFNYMNAPATDKQHNDIMSLYAGVKSNSESFPVQFEVNAGFKHFGQGYITNDIDKNDETTFFVNGGVWAPMDEEQKVGIDFDIDNFSYSTDNLSSYMSLRFNPYFAMTGDNYNVRLGAHADYQTGNDKGVVFAPNIKADYTFSESFVLYADIDGGRVINDLERLNTLSPYFRLKSQLPSTYVPIDAKLGLKASPMNGMWFNIFGGYRMSRHELSYGYPGEDFYYTDFLEDKANCSYAGAELKYGYKDKLSTSFKSVFYGWSTKADDKDAFLASKPKFTLDFNVEAKVIENLKVGAGYEYAKTGDIPEYATTDNKVGDVSNLHVNANYNIFKDVNIFAQVNNILNKQYYTGYGYPSEKLNFIGGLRFTF